MHVLIASLTVKEKPQIKISNTPNDIEIKNICFVSIPESKSELLKFVIFTVYIKRTVEHRLKSLL